VPDTALLLKEYYALRVLDEQGFPKAEMLVRLGLDDLKSKLYQ
jgi:aldehyde:ferredoxin oxidoreductase